uniref:Neurotransmitter-gated ion-channel ligand-binding domain-containing protein n=1 Tax=Acrobeloides nanus TaxID=290746 RepID=A0A914E4P6_9BILA
MFKKWQDPRLVWDPAKYDNISQLYIPASSIWMPQIYFYNSIQTSSPLSDPDALLFVLINLLVYVRFSWLPSSPMPATLY